MDISWLEKIITKLVKRRKLVLQSNFNKTINKVVNKRLLQAPNEVKKCFPEFFMKSDVIWISFSTQEYFMLVFGTSKEEKRVEKLKKNNFNPYPGLISCEDNNSSAFRLDKSRNTFIKDCSVDNIYSFSLGKDCTIILQNHKQSLNTPELGEYSYKVRLAYIVTFGDEIHKANFIDFLDGLISYSIKEWRKNHA